MHQKRKNNLFVITGPSGVGKTEVYKGVIKIPELSLKRLVTCTTRNPRAGETQGVDYNFFTREKFEEMISGNELIEHAEVYGNYYGSRKSDVEKLLNSGYNPLILLDVQGAETIHKKFENTISLFILPENLENLKQRLYSRNEDKKEDIEKRIYEAQREIALKNRFTHTLINSQNRLDYTIERAKELIKTEISKL